MEDSIKEIELLNLKSIMRVYFYESKTIDYLELDKNERRFYVYFKNKLYDWKSFKADGEDEAGYHLFMLFFQMAEEIERLEKLTPSMV
jgi:hypothetical protein